MRVTTARIFYQGYEHSKIYYNGEWVSILGERVEDGELINNICYEIDATGKRTYHYGELRNGYSAYDYTVTTSGGQHECNTYNQVRRWRNDEPFIWFRYSGACTIYVRGNGMLKFNNGQRVFVHVRALKVKYNSHDAYSFLMNDITAVACPEDATECIFIGQLMEGGAYTSWVPDLEDDTTYSNTMYAKWVHTLGFENSTVQEIRYCENEGMPAQSEGGKDKLDFRPLTPINMLSYQSVDANGTILTYHPGYYKRYRYSNNTGYYHVFTGTNAYNYWRTFMNTPIVEIPLQYFKARAKIYEHFAESEWRVGHETIQLSKQWPHFYAYSVEQCFAGCKNLKVVPANFFSTVKPCHAYRCFYNCTGLTTIEPGALDWFMESDGENNDEMYSETHFGSDSFMRLIEAFKGCTGLRGTVDAIWEKIKPNYSPRIMTGWPSVTEDSTGYFHVSNGCFEGCTGLSNYDAIPDWWKLPRGTKIYYQYKGATT